MPEGLIDTAAQAQPAEERRFNGVAIGVVINNVDCTGLGRVQIRLPWLPGYEPWARVASLMAGTGRGTYFIPQIDDEVLVAFNHGDVREPYIIGSLWNGPDRPPAGLDPTDAVKKRLIRTPLGHEIEFDDLAQSITITSVSQQKIQIDPTKIELSTVGATATISADTKGNVSISSVMSIELKAPKITLDGNQVEIKGLPNVSIQGGLVKIN